MLGQLWPRESGVLYKTSQYAGRIGSGALASYAALADTFPFEEECPPTSGGAFGLLVREPVGVVGAIIPWNAPVALICHKIGPALLAGCTVVLKSSPEAPGEGYVFAEVAEQIGLPPGVLNVVTADREVSELLVTDPGVDKITFTGSTAAGRRIASLCGERIARCTLELGGKSAAVILDDMDLGTAATTLARAECGLNGQVCSSLTRVIVTKNRHDELVDALAATFGRDARRRPVRRAVAARPARLGPPARPGRSATSPRASTRARRSPPAAAVPKDLDRGFYVEPTVFGNVDNGSTIGREEIFGPVLAVIPAADEQDAVRIANDTIYGLNASVFTNDADRAREVAGQLRSGTVGHNAFRTDFGMAFGGFKQSGIGREGGKEGLLPFLETKTVILEGRPDAYPLTGRSRAMLRDDVQLDLRRRPCRRARRTSSSITSSRSSATARRASSNATARRVALGGPLLSAVVPGQRGDAEVPGGRSGTRRRPLRAPLRGHDPGRVRRARARPGDGRRRRVGGAAVPDVPSLRRNPVPRKPTTTTSRSRWCERGTTGCSTSGARRTPIASSRRRSSRCGTCRLPSPRSSAAPRKGSRAVLFVENPHPLGLPSFPTGHWRPVFEACNETGLPLSMHIGTSMGLLKPSPETTPSVGIALCGVNSMSALGDLIFSGTFNGLPNCRVALSEGGAGWVPYVLERLDYTWERSRYEGLREHGAAVGGVRASTSGCA